MESKSVEDILEDLSYSFSTPEAQGLQLLIIEKKFAKATKMLLKYTSAADAKRVIDYFHEKNTRKIELVEITIKDIVLGNEKLEYLFKIGTKVAKSSVFKIHHDSLDYNIYIGGQMFLLKQVNQVWKIL